MLCVGENPGPFSLLQNCRRAGRRVRVAIRHCTGVRGVCEGLLVVYDRHMNIVLRDVTEWCTPFRTVANGGITQSKSKRQRKKKLESLKQANQEEQDRGVATEDCSDDVADSKEIQQWETCRTVKQLFIRGDSIIYITPAEK